VHVAEMKEYYDDEFVKFCKTKILKFYCLQ